MRSTVTALPAPGEHRLQAGALLPCEPMRVAYQGEPGAYSERAVLAALPDAEPLPCETVRLVFSRVTSGLSLIHI